MITLAALLVALFVKPGLVLAAAAAIAACLRRHTAAARHAVWAGAILATLALPVLSSALPPLRIPALFHALEWPLPEAARSGTTATARDNGLPPAPAGARPGNGVTDRVRKGGAGPGEQLARAMIAFWILGALLFGARRVVGEVQVRRILRRGGHVSDPRLQHLFSDIARSSGIRGPVGLRLSDETTSPAVAGVFRPVVLLPAAAVSWGEGDVSQVLIHELGHVARRDCLFNRFGDVAKIIYWCNPFVYLAIQRMRAESENACDDLVLRRGTDPEGYAHLLLTVARTARMEGELPGAVTAMARPRELESRLLSVLDHRVRRSPLPRWMPPALAGLGILFALPAAALTLQAAPPLPSAPTAIEPDRRADSLAGPASERLPIAPDRDRVSLGATEALAGPDSALARRLIAALGHQPGDEGDLVRERAAWALSQASGGRLVEPLLQALDADDWRVRAYAAWALAAARDPRAVSPLIPLLEHPVWRLRAMAAYALRELRDPRAEAAMNAVLTDPAWQVRLEAVEYVAALGGHALSERLRPRLADRHVAVRLAAEQALPPR